MSDLFQIEFTGKIDNHPSYQAWPTMIRLENDELLVVCSGNRKAHVCPYGRIFLYRSVDGGQNWTGPQRLSDGPLDDRDPGLVRAVDGSLLMSYITSIKAFCLDPEEMPPDFRERADNTPLSILRKELNYWMRRSTDNGRTWSERYTVPIHNPHGPTLLRDGSLLWVGRDVSAGPEYICGGARFGEWLAAARSEDHGKTWEIISRIPAPPGIPPRGCHELHAVQSDDGRIIAAIRSEPDTWLTESLDNGLSWSIPQKKDRGIPAASVQHREWPHSAELRLSGKSVWDQMRSFGRSRDPLADGISSL